MRSTHLHT